MKKVVFTKTELIRIKQVCNTGEISYNALALELDVGRTSLKRVIKELGLEKNKSYSSNSGIKFEWTAEKDARLKELYNSPKYTVVEVGEMFGISEDTTTKRAKELKLTKVRKSIWSDIDEEKLLKDVQVLPLSMVAYKLDLDVETVRNRIKVIGQIELLDRNRRKIFVQPLDYFEDLANPRYSATDVADKWNLSSSTILEHRKKYFGKFKVQKDTTHSTTSIERKVIDLLEELDVAYISQKQIGKYIVDLYLGNKHLIEVDGDYWHNRLQTKLKDRRKLNDLKKLGYTVLVIKEHELKDINNVRQTLKTFMVSLHSNVYKK